MIQIGVGLAAGRKRQFGLFARLTSRIQGGGECRRQPFFVFCDASQEARRLRIENRNPRAAFDYENSARQAFQNTAQTFAHAMVLFEALRQVAVGDFQFLTQMGNLPLQLSVRAL